MFKLNAEEIMRLPSKKFLVIFQVYNVKRSTSMSRAFVNLELSKLTCSTKLLIV